MPGWTRNFLPHGFSLSCGSTTFLAVGFHSPNHTQLERIKEKATKAAGHCGVQSSQQRAVPGRVPKVFGSLTETATGRSYLQHRRQPKEPTTHAWALASNILSTSREMHTPLAAPHSDLHLLWGPGMCAPVQPCLGDSCPNPCPPNQVKSHRQPDTRPLGNCSIKMFLASVFSPLIIRVRVRGGCSGAEGWLRWHFQQELGSGGSRASCVGAHLPPVPTPSNNSLLLPATTRALLHLPGHPHRAARVTTLLSGWLRAAAPQ